jgi:hypothetical protein
MYIENACTLSQRLFDGLYALSVASVQQRQEHLLASTTSSVYIHVLLGQNSWCQGTERTGHLGRS